MRGCPPLPPPPYGGPPLLFTMLGARGAGAGVAGAGVAGAGALVGAGGAAHVHTWRSCRPSVHAAAC